MAVQASGATRRLVLRTQHTSRDKCKSMLESGADQEGQEGMREKNKTQEGGGEVSMGKGKLE